MSNQVQQTGAERLAAATGVDIETVKATGWSEEQMSRAFNRVSRGGSIREAFNGLSVGTGMLALVATGMMLASPRFGLFALGLGFATWLLRDMGRNAQRQRVDTVAREIEQAALARLTGPKV